MLPLWTIEHSTVYNKTEYISFWWESFPQFPPVFLSTKQIKAELNHPEREGLWATVVSLLELMWSLERSENETIFYLSHLQSINQPVQRRFWTTGGNHMCWMGMTHWSLWGVNWIIHEHQTTSWISWKVKSPTHTKKLIFNYLSENKNRFSTGYTVKLWNLGSLFIIPLLLLPSNRVMSHVLQQSWNLIQDRGA